MGSARLTATLVPRGPAAAVVLDEELANALAADAQARDAFDRLAYTHRKDYARWIDESKRDETRQQRVARALELLREGKTRT
jgi:uncharacterized protein YdeI (YjbR/CyaY-like superfamily)